MNKYQSFAIKHFLKDSEYLREDYYELIKSIREMGIAESEVCWQYQQDSEWQGPDEVYRGNLAGWIEEMVRDLEEHFK